MKKVIGPVFGAFLIASAPAAAQPVADSKATSVDPASLALSHQIVNVAFPPEKRPEMFNSMMDSLVEQSRQNLENLGFAKDKDFKALIDRSTKRMFDQLKATMIAYLPDFFEGVSRAYARDFSKDDLNAILAFVKTPAGQHYFERAPLILKDPDVQAASQHMMAQLIAKKPEIDRENKQDIDDYIASKSKQEKVTQPRPVS